MSDAHKIGSVCPSEQCQPWQSSLYICTQLLLHLLVEEPITSQLRCLALGKRHPIGIHFVSTSWVFSLRPVPYTLCVV